MLTPRAVEEVMDEASWKLSPPVDDQEVEEVVLDEASFKFFTPQPDQGGVDARADAVQEEGVLEAERGEILGEDDFKPIPAAERESGEF